MIMAHVEQAEAVTRHCYEDGSLCHPHYVQEENQSPQGSPTHQHVLPKGGKEIDIFYETPYPTQGSPWQMTVGISQS